MRVFKACMLIMKYHLKELILYIAIFLPLSILFATSYTENYSTDFEAAKPAYSVINRDENTELIDGLCRYLSQNGTEVVLEDDKQTLQDANFYHESEYILIIPEGFSKALFTDSEISLETVTSPDSINGFYINRMVEQYFNLTKNYHLADNSINETELVNNILNDLSVSADITKVQFSNVSPVPESFKLFLRFSTYVMLVLIILCTTSILMAFSRTEIQMRNLCSPLKSGSFSIQKALYCLTTSMICWLLLTITGLIFNHKILTDIDNRILVMLLANFFIFMLVCMSIAVVISSFVKNANLQNVAANITSLVISFLGGAFVPLEMLSDTMLTVAKFTPAYWYNIANNSICSLTNITSENVMPILQTMGVELCFAIALFCISLAINKYQNTSEKSFGTTQTVLEQ